MSLDNLKLPDTVLQGLYNKSLYVLSSAKSTPSESAITTISFLGDNLKKIAVIVSSDDAIYLPDDELNFLLGILTACKLSMADVALINLGKNPGLTYTAITEQLKADKIFLFGLVPEQLGLPLQFPNYQIQQYNNQLYLSSANLQNLQTDKAEKLKLWTCLKKVFSI